MKILSGFLIAIPLALFSSLGIGNEEPITIFGLNVAMTKDQVIAEMKKRDLNCDSGPPLKNKEMLGFDEVLFCKKEGEGSSSVGIEFSNGKIVKIDISCDLLGICDYSLKAAGKALVDSTNIDRLEYEKQSGGFDAFCSSGKAGDKICVLGILGGQARNIRLLNYHFGNPKPSFK